MKTLIGAVAVFVLFFGWTVMPTEDYARAARVALFVLIPIVVSQLFGQGKNVFVGPKEKITIESTVPAFISALRNIAQSGSIGLKTKLVEEIAAETLDAGFTSKTYVTLLNTSESSAGLEIAVQKNHQARLQITLESYPGVLEAFKSELRIAG